MTENSKIIIKREKRFHTCLKDYKIYLDSSQIGTISNNQKEEFDISPGKHKIRLNIDWCKSNELEFEIRKNQKINFLCGPSRDVGLFEVSNLFAFLWSIFYRNKYLYIKREK